MSAPFFQRATASKALAMTSVLCTGAAVYLEMQPEGLSQGKRLSLKTLFTSQTMFRKLFPELMLGAGLLYVFRHIERVIGTRRFVSFCFVSSTVSLSLQLAIITFTSLLGEGQALTTGAYAPIFSLLVLYFAHVPAISQPFFGGVNINHKLPVYAISLYLALVDGKASLIPSICGLVAGLFAWSQLKHLKMPDSLAEFGAKYIEPLIKSNNTVQDPRRQPNQRWAGNRRDMFADHGEGGDVLLPNFFGPPPPAAAVNAVPEPRDEDIATLVGMGFDAQAVRAALRRNHNNVNRAAESLLNEM